MFRIERVVVSFMIFICLANTVLADEKVEGAFKKGLTWLKTMYDSKSGAFTSDQGRKIPSVAFTGLCFNAIAGSKYKEENKQLLDSSIQYILKHQNQDGSFSEPGGFFKTYCTSIVLASISLYDEKKYSEQIKKAQAYLILSQGKDGMFEGGFGYKQLEPTEVAAKESQVADMSNTAFAAEGLKLSGSTNKESWDKIIKFVQRCQNSSEAVNDPVWSKLLEEKGYKIGNDGGVIYAPVPDKDQNKAGATKDKDGKYILTSYGSMTYDALYSYLCAGLKKDDPRIKAAIGWIKNNYVLDRHPGFPFDSELPAGKRRSAQGLYYYYLVIARALSAYGEQIIVTADGVKHNWAKELSDKLVSLQSKDGYWQNDNNRWMEQDKVLTTSYVLNVMNIVLKELK